MTDDGWRAEAEAELMRLTKVLGGGWRIDRGVMPVVVLTDDEARKLEQRLQLAEAVAAQAEPYARPFTRLGEAVAAWRGQG